MATKEKSVKDKVFEYMSKHPTATKEALFQAFPDDKEVTVVRNRRLYFEKKEGKKKVPTKKPVSTPIEPVEEKSIVQALPKPLLEALEADSEVLIEMIAKYKQSKMIKALFDENEITIEEPVKTYSYSLSQSLHTDFEKVCIKVGLSKRKALHHAMKGFIDYFNQ
jgi:hypothetical protein